MPIGCAAPGPPGATPGPEGGVCLAGGDGGPAAGGFRSTSGAAPSAGPLLGVNLGCGVKAGLPLSNGLPLAPGAGDALPAGDVPGLSRGVPRGGCVARGLAAREMILRGVAPGETAPAGLPGKAAGVPAAPAAAGVGPPGARATAAVGGGTFFGFSVLIFCFSCASF